MNPMIGAGLITGGLGLIGSMFSSESTAQANQQNVQAQLAMNQSNQAFTERMSNTAYQRSAADMRAAGLNPIAMYSSGSGSPASSPQGTGVAPKVEPTGRAYEALGKHAADAVSSAVSFKTMEKMTEEVANLITERKKIEATTGLIEQSTKTESERTHLTATEIAKLQNLMPGYRFEGMTSETLEKLAKAHPEVFKDVLGVDWMSKHTRSTTDQIASAIGSALSLKRLGLERKGLEERYKPRRDTSESTTEHFEGGSRTFNERWYNR